MLQKHPLKLSLIVPNFRWCDQDESAFWHMVPYNLCLLAAMVEDLCDVTILDAYEQNLSQNAFCDVLSNLQPDVAGITVMMDQLQKAGHLACELIKKTLKQTVVILGGVYATVDPGSAIEDENVDIVIVGEGEYTLRSLVQSFKKGINLPEVGIRYKKGGVIVGNGRSAFIENLDKLPFPAYHLIDFKRYSRTCHRRSVDSPRAFPYARILTSRGCRQRCVFCQVKHISGNSFRMRSAENVLAEIRWLKENYGIQSLIFDDDNLFTNKERAKRIFDGMIQKNLSFPWTSISTAVFHLDQEMIDLMKKSGCRYICVAIESGSKRVLKEIIQKPVVFEHAAKMIKSARKAGIFVAANFIIGFPGETWEEIRETIRMAETLEPDYMKLFHAIPLKGTRLWDLCLGQGVFKDTFEYKDVKWSQGQIETEEFSSHDLTILRAYEWDRINFNSHKKRKKTADMMGISLEELDKIRRSTRNNVYHGIFRKVESNTNNSRQPFSKV